MILDIADLSVKIGGIEIVHIDELSIGPGERLGLVGESGSGKTMTAMSVIGLQPREAVLTGSISFGGREILGLDDKSMSPLRSEEIAVIFQDPSRALNPTMRIGKQMAEPFRIHTDLSRSAIKERVLGLLDRVQLSGGEDLLRRYPHQLSGGQQQRVVIATSVALNPKLLIADEPTTALDATVQEGILALLLELSKERDMSLLFVSHDLGVIRASSERVAVMYGGRIVEVGPTDDVVRRPYHRYTKALIAASPSLTDSDGKPAVRGERLSAIPGSVPPMGGFPDGCPFRGRCGYEISTCSDDPPSTVLGNGHQHLCWNPATPGELHATSD